MASDHERPTARLQATPSRRRFLAGASVVALGTVAGCAEVTQQSFEAAPVVLPDDGREELALGETVREPLTIERTGPADTKLTITNHAAVYTREAGQEER